MKLSKYAKGAIINAIMQDLPYVDHAAKREDIQRKLVEAMSPQAQALYAVQPNALHRDYVDTASPHDWSGGYCAVGALTAKQIAAVVKPYEEQSAMRRKARAQLESAFEAVNTLKQALDLFPEFEKYYPTEAQPTKNLPALANVVADLSTLGWPKGGAK